MFFDPCAGALHVFDSFDDWRFGQRFEQRAESLLQGDGTSHDEDFDGLHAHRLSFRVDSRIGALMEIGYIK